MITILPISNHIAGTHESDLGRDERSWHLLQDTSAELCGLPGRVPTDIIRKVLYKGIDFGLLLEGLYIYSVVRAPRAFRGSRSMQYFAV